MSSTRRGNKGKNTDEQQGNPSRKKSNEVENAEVIFEGANSLNTSTTPAGRVAITNIDDIVDGMDLKLYNAAALKEQTCQLVTKMDHINTEIKELHEETSNILTRVQFNSEQIEHNTSEIERVKKERNDMKADFEKRFLTQELYSRKSNLLIYGVPDDKDPGPASMDVFRLLGVEGVDNMQFVNIHRLPRKSTDPANFRATMPKPIVVKFVRMEDRQTVFNASVRRWASLKDKKITIRTDLPVVLKKQRGRLANRAFELRKTHKVQTRIQEKGIDIFLQIRKGPSDQRRSAGIEETP